VPQGASLQTNLHPSDTAIGGNGELPAFWELIAEYVTTE
jgi:hypothetical protein